MITVHHLNNSRSQRVLWLLEELEVPYQIKCYQREASMLAPDELKSAPAGQIPGYYRWESRGGGIRRDPGVPGGAL